MVVTSFRCDTAKFHGSVLKSLVTPHLGFPGVDRMVRVAAYRRRDNGIHIIVKYTTETQIDKRIMQLYPTQKTLDLLPDIAPILSQWEACLTSDVSEEERAVLERVLSRMKDKASEWMANR